MKLLLLAEESAGLRVLRSISTRDDELVAVVTSAQEANGYTSIEKYARELGAEVLHPARTQERGFAELIRANDIDILLNVHSLYLLDDSIIEAPRIGSFNLHPGPLPQLAGLNAPSWAIYLGNKTHAVTLHWMQAGIDTGAVAYSAEFPIGDEDTGLSVSSQCVKSGVPLIGELLDTAARDRSAIPAIPQDPRFRRVFYRGDIPNGGKVVWSDSARQIAAFIRASYYGPFASPWGQPQASIDKHTFGIVRARETGRRAKTAPGTVVLIDPHGFEVAAGDEIVRIEKIQKAGHQLDWQGLLKVGDIFG